MTTTHSRVHKNTIQSVFYRENIQKQMNLLHDMLWNEGEHDVLHVVCALRSKQTNTAAVINTGPIKVAKLIINKSRLGQGPSGVSLPQWTCLSCSKADASDKPLKLPSNLSQVNHFK